MELRLQREDVNDWIYRGEGAFNIVLAYNGSYPLFVGKVLRVRKVVRNGSGFEDDLPELTSHESVVWKENKEIVSAPTRELAEQHFTECVMRPLLGHEQIDVGTQIPVSKEFLQAVESSFLHHRASWRVVETMVDIARDSVLLVSDHSVFPYGTLKERFCISIEIKPKSGFLPWSEFVEDKNAIKRRVTRFKMHQALKLSQGKLLCESAYNPLDMFFGSKERIRKAISDLFMTPQNNFRVFLNGSLVFSDLNADSGITPPAAHEAFENVLKCVISADDGEHTGTLFDIVAEVIFRSGLLDRLLAVQKLDAIDIEGAIHAYYNVISRPCPVCRDFGEGSSLKKFAPLHSITLDESVKIVRDYLISATAKDLSMIICLRPKIAKDQSSPYGSISLESTQQSFDYKVSFIDLDMKPLKKMEHYYKLDKRIMDCYNRMLRAKQSTGA